MTWECALERAHLLLLTTHLVLIQRRDFFSRYFVGTYYVPVIVLGNRIQSCIIMISDLKKFSNPIEETNSIQIVIAVL